MKKRVVGAVVLVVLGIALPLLLARCMQGGDGDTEAMRVYEVAPDGEARPANANENNAPAADDDVDGATSVASDDEREAAPAESEVETPDLPDAVSPASVPERTPVESVRAPESEPEPEPAAEAPSEPAGATAQQESSNDGGSLRQNASFSGGYVVQVASFRDEASAEKVARELNSEFKAFYRAGDVNGTTYYRVRVGPFENEAAANSAAAQLRRAGRATLVRRAE